MILPVLSKGVYGSRGGGDFSPRKTPKPNTIHPGHRKIPNGQECTSPQQRWSLPFGSKKGVYHVTTIELADGQQFMAVTKSPNHAAIAVGCRRTVAPALENCPNLTRHQQLQNDGRAVIQQSCLPLRLNFAYFREIETHQQHRNRYDLRLQPDRTRLFPPEPSCS